MNTIYYFIYLDFIWCLPSLLAYKFWTCFVKFTHKYLIFLSDWNGTVILVPKCSLLVYRNIKINLYMLYVYKFMFILCSAMLLNSLILGVPSVDLLKFPIQTSVLPTNTDNFTFSFPICTSFISFSCLLYYLELTALYWLRLESRYPYFIPDLRRKALSFTIKCNVSYRFVVDGLYQVSKVPLTLFSSESLKKIINGYWIFIKCFLCVDWYYHVILLLFPINMMNNMDW